MPQPHKGFAVLRDALMDPRCADWHLALAGPGGHPEFEACLARLGARCHCLGVVPQERMPALLAAADVAPIPQVNVRFAQSQLPAKALEAMAMGCPPVASRVSDLPFILGEGARGWLVEPGDADGLAAALVDAAAKPAERIRRGLVSRARLTGRDDGDARAAGHEDRGRLGAGSPWCHLRLAPRRVRRPRAKRGD
jgi:glycosyltransferase involved in cell wall biosynthesis